MSEFLLRVVIVAALAAVSIGWVRWSSARRVTGNLGLTAGLWVVTGPGCRWCAQLLDGLALHGAAATVIDATDERIAAFSVRSVPTVLVTDGSGAVVERRSGRRALDELEILIDTSMREAAA